MKYNKVVNLLLIVMVILTILSMGIATYAYFTVTNNEEENENKLLINDNLKLEFSDNETSTLTLLNINQNKEVTKRFTITNNGEDAYYDIVFTEIANSFNNKTSLIYSISGTSSDKNNKAVYIKERVVPSSNISKVASFIKINKGVTHSYVVTVKYLNNGKENINADQKTFYTKIVVVSSTKTNEIYKPNTLGDKILKNNNIKEANIIDYSIVEDGLYKTNDSVNGATVYFFRGSNDLNNNVMFAGYCWKIIRTTESSGIRMIYNSKNCSSLDNTLEQSSAFNGTVSSNTYIGFMTGSNSNSYELEHSNINKSNVFNALNSWSNYLTKYEDKIIDSAYCNNRVPKQFSYEQVNLTSNGFGINNTGYDSYYRLSIIDPPVVTFDCKLDNDKFSRTLEYGNSLFVESANNFVGLITADEALAAGIGNEDNYLKSNSSYWTMSPALFYNNVAYNYIIDTNNLTIAQVNQNNGVRPVITIDGNILVVSGTGSIKSPYILSN